MTSGSMRLLVAVAALMALGSAHAQMSIPGSLGVSPSGAASYQIPIKVPPGIAGMEPKLSLVYNSQQGNGLLGMGWGLSGLSGISRCPQTISQDTVRGSVNYDVNDRFCLDGQRLIAISGVNGANGTEYRTEREAFTKVISYGAAGAGPSWFKAWTKAGQIIEYGNTADSKVEAQGKTTVRFWAVNRIQDTKGNYFTFGYIEDNPSGTHLPQRIDYTGNSGTGVSPDRMVWFEYESRTDPNIGYVAGSLMQELSRLKTIKTYIAGNLVKDYRLAYDYNLYNASRSLLNNVTECNSGGTCQPPLQLGWATGVGPNTPSSSWIVQSNVNTQNGQYGNFQPHVADFNGDGKADILWDHKLANGQSSGISRNLWLSNGDGSFTILFNVAQQNGQYGNFAPHFADFNGDGKIDILWDHKLGDSVTQSSGISRNLWLSNGDGSFTIIYNVAQQNGYYGGFVPYIADFNGDGRSDIFWDHKGTNNLSSGSSRIIWFSTGAGTVSTFNIYGNAGGLDGYYIGYEPHIADFNGDGIADILMDHKTQANGQSSGVARDILLGNGNGGFSQVVNVAGQNGYYGSYVPHIGDFNGDGKADILWDHKLSTGQSSGISRVIWAGKGDGSFALVPNPMGQDGYYGGFIPYLADFNGDGKTDIFWDSALNDGQSSGSSRILWLSKGSGSYGVAEFGIYGNLAQRDGQYGNYVPEIADFTGDGKADIFWDHKIASSPSQSSGVSHDLWINSAGLADLLTSVSNGLGANQTLFYNPLTNGATYAADSDAVYPIMDLRIPLHIVSSIVSSNGNGGTMMTQYAYGGLKAEAGTGRGLLGFRWTEATQVETGIKTRTEFRQDWPYIGLPSQSKRIAPGGSVILAQSDPTYSCMNPASGASTCSVAAGNRYFPYASQSDDTSYDLNGTFVNKVRTVNGVPDLYGNMLSISVSHLNSSGVATGYSKTTTNTYLAPDTANWILGRLIRSTVQSTCPGTDPVQCQ